MPGTWPPNNQDDKNKSSSPFGAAANKFGNNTNNNSNSSPFGNRVGASNNNNTSSSLSPLQQRQKEKEEQERKQKEEAEEKKRKQQQQEEDEKKRKAEEEEQLRKKAEEEEEKKRKEEKEKQQNENTEHQHDKQGENEDNKNNANNDDDNEADDQSGEAGQQNDEEEQLNDQQQQPTASPSEQFMQRLADPDEQLQPGLRRLLSTIAPLRPTFAAMLAGDFVVPWPSGAYHSPPFDPLSQPSVKKALKLKGDAAMSLRSLAITATNSIVLIGANGFANTIYSVDQMRKVDLVRANRTDPCVLIVDLVDEDDVNKRSTAYFVLLTGMESGDRAEMAVKTSFNKSVPVEILDKPPEVRMTDMQPLLRRMRKRTEEHDKLIAERSAVLDRIRKLHLQNIARSAVERISVDVEDAPAHERERQTMLNLLINHVCGSQSRSKGEYY